MRVRNHMLEDLIANEGESVAGPLSPLGVLRLALDLQEARAALERCYTDPGALGYSRPDMFAIARFDAINVLVNSL